MYNYDRHINQVPAALKVARRAAMALHDEDGNEIGQRAAHDYKPAQGWILVLDAGNVLTFHYDDTDTLLAQLQPVSEDENPGARAALLYKVDPGLRSNNVRATKQVGELAVRRIKAAIKSGELQEVRIA